MFKQRQRKRPRARRGGNWGRSSLRSCIQRQRERPRARREFKSSISSSTSFVFVPPWYDLQHLQQLRQLTLLARRSLLPPLRQLSSSFSFFSFCCPCSFNIFFHILPATSLLHIYATLDYIHTHTQTDRHTHTHIHTHNIYTHTC